MTGKKSCEYQKFLNYILGKRSKEEKFEHIKIVHDAIGSITFDYLFWEGKKIKDWGNEYWYLIKAEGKWKIMSVIFS
ncbi:hypothetical protein [uncultured Sphingobacterium sp.]|uniref:hypothetical protein n=1 Tax=uncultured Sphingobacterium sp. TaxID=182688 RepID=UPI003747FDA0